MTRQVFGSEPQAMFLPAPTPPMVFYFYDVIGEQENYVSFLQTLDNANEGEEIHVRLNTPGGSLWSCMAIVNAIQRTKATVIGYADGLVASAGTFILFVCHGIIFEKYSLCMLHDGSDDASGPQKFSESKKSSEAISKLYENMAYDIYGPFFEPNEIERILRGEDFWQDAEQMGERCERYEQRLAQKNEEDSLEDNTKPELLVECGVVDIFDHLDELPSEEEVLSNEVHDGSSTLVEKSDE